MCNDSAVVTGCASDFTAVTSNVFDVEDDRTLWELTDRENVTDLDCSLLADVDGHTGVDTFSSDKVFGHGTVTVWITEFDGCKWCTTTRIVDNSLDNTTEITLAFSKIEGTVFRCTLTEDSVCYKDDRERKCVMVVIAGG